WVLQIRESGGPFIMLASDSYKSGPLHTDGTEYPMYMSIVGNTVSLELPDGTTREITNKAIGRLSGAYAMWQILNTPAPTVNPRWEDVDAMPINPGVVFDSNQHLASLMLSNGATARVSAVGGRNVLVTGALNI